MDPSASTSNVFRLKAAASRVDLLQAMRASTLQTMPPLLSAVLSGADDALFDLVQKSHSTFEQQQFFDAMRELRRQRGAIEQRYRDHFVAAFVGLERRKPVVAHYSQPGETSNELSLLDEQELEEQLASEQVAQAIERRHGAILARLDAQFGELAGGLEIDGMRNPVGPGHMAASLRAGLRDCDLAPSARLVLFKLYEQSLLPALNAFYAELGKRLDAGGLADVVVKAHSTHGAPQAPSPVSHQASRRNEDGARDDLFTALHGLLEDYRAAQRAAGRAPASDPGQSQHAPISAPSALSVLSLMQRSLPEAVQHAIDDPRQSLAARLKQELLTQAYDMGMGAPGAALTPGDEDAIDLVGMLFEVLLNERQFQDQVRRLFGQMVVPYTKVAMLDRRMFMHKAHPARRMLNSVAEACDGNVGETVLERELLERVVGLVDRLVAEFNEDLAVFETLQEEFDSFLEQHRKRVELAERRAAEAQRGRERLEQARAVASMELAILMGAREAPGAIDEFLRRYWTHHLALVILRDGTDTERFAQARTIGERLWQAMLDSEAGRPRTESLAPLLEPALSSSGVTSQAAADVVQAVESLLDALRNGDRARVDSTLLPDLIRAMPVEDELREPVEIGEARAAEADAEAASNVVPLRPAPATELQRLLAAEAAVETAPAPKVTERGTSSHFAAFWDETSPATEETAPHRDVPAADAPAADLSVVAGKDTVTVDPADLEKIRKLEVGNWVELIGEDGTPQPAKLSWVSPISSRLLFVNRRGMRVCAASAEELAVMLQQGKLSLREIDTAFERAMTQVLGKLRESASQRSGA